jgi:UDP-N-acetylmuramoylalanine--D-glutamate ligase
MNNPQIDFKDKKIAVIGEGVEGKSSAEFLQKQSAKVEIRDKKQGDDYLEDLNRFDLVVRSPGVKISTLGNVTPEKITSQTKLFFDLSPTKNIIGVTGTKGKGTTATLIYEMLKAAGFDAYLGGNIGVPPFDFIDQLTPESWVVLEMSSFQLQDLTVSPHIAVLLMITSEHMDYHNDINEYIEAKRNILRHQSSSDIVIVNRDYPASNESDIHSNGKVYYISREREVEEGCFALGNQIILRSKGNDLPVIDTRELLLRGDHNHENACAAALAAYLAGVRINAITDALKTFKGLEHRLELVDKINDIEYYNDSFSTTPETAIAAIESFKNPEILILGGSSKNSDFTELGEIIGKRENIKAIIGVGDEWQKIKEKIVSLKPETLVIEGADSMGKIVLAASKIAEPGDVVLLSPACASFGMFQNYKDRGNQFKTEVQNLKLQGVN